MTQRQKGKDPLLRNTWNGESKFSRLFFLSFFPSFSFQARFEFLLGILALVGQSSTLNQAGKKLRFHAPSKRQVQAHGGAETTDKGNWDESCVRVRRERRVPPAWIPGKPAGIAGAASRVLWGLGRGWAPSPRPPNCREQTSRGTRTAQSVPTGPRRPLTRESNLETPQGRSWLSPEQLSRPRLHSPSLSPSRQALL